MSIEDGKRYVFINKNSGTALDLDSRDNRSVQGWSRHGGPNQQWEVTRLTNGWEIKNVQVGTYLGRAGNENGKRIICTPTRVIWNFARVSTNVYRILPFLTLKCVDLENGNGANGTVVQIWDLADNQNQQWEAQQV